MVNNEKWKLIFSLEYPPVLVWAWKRELHSANLDFLHPESVLSNFPKIFFSKNHNINNLHLISI